MRFFNGPRARSDGKFGNPFQVLGEYLPKCSAMFTVGALLVGFRCRVMLAVQLPGTEGAWLRASMSPIWVKGGGPRAPPPRGGDSGTAFPGNRPSRVPPPPSECKPP